MLISTWYRIPSRRSFLVAVVSAVLGLAMVHHPRPAAAQEVKQIKLTEKQVEGFIASYKDVTELTAKLPEGADKPDPKTQAQLEAVVKKHGFADFAQYDDVSNNISMVLAGIDPQTKKFTEPPDMIKREIEDVKADKSMSDADKKQELEDLNEALKSAKPIQFKENIALVTKYFDKLTAVMNA